MNIETVIALIATVGGLSGLISAITTTIFKVIDYKRSKKGETLEAKLQPLLEKLDRQDKELHEIRLDTTRTQLIMLIEHQPHNYDTIIKIAERYFVSLGGNWWVASEFSAWARKEGITLPSHLWDAVARELPE